jgi:hypothetical protein
MTSDLRKLLVDQRLWLGPAPFLVLILGVVNVWAYCRSPTLEQGRAGSLLVANPISATRPSDANYDLSCGEEMLAYWPYIPDAGKQRLAILSGMSQMFTINNPKPGDRTISQWMDDALKTQGVRVWGEAAPNLCNEEATMQLLALCSEARTTPAVFIYGLCFDKFRNVDLRPGYEDFMRSRPDVEAIWKKTAERVAKTYPLASAKMLSTAQGLRASAGADEHTFESRLRARVGSWLPLVGERKDIYIAVALDVYQARNAILHITPTSKRPIIQSRYDLNKEFLSLMTDIAREHHVQFIAYIIPLNPQADNPYVPEQYQEFKAYARQFTQERGIPFANLENIVPADEWGIFNGGPDFKHFSEEGHERTAKAVMAAFGPWLTGTATSATSIMQ